MQLALEMQKCLPRCLELVLQFSVSILRRGQFLLRRRGKRVDLRLHPREGGGKLALPELVDPEDAELRPHLRPEVGMGDTRHPRPDAHQRLERLSVLHRGLLVLRERGEHRRAFRPALHPVVPQGVVAFGLIQFDLGAEFGAYLLRVDAGEKGGELADGDAEGFTVPAVLGNCFDDRNTSSFLVGVELYRLGSPRKPQIFDNGLHRGVRLIIEDDAEDGVPVEGDGRELTHTSLQ